MSIVIHELESLCSVRVGDLDLGLEISDVRVYRQGMQLAKGYAYLLDMANMNTYDAPSTCCFIGYGNPRSEKRSPGRNFVAADTSDPLELLELVQGIFMKYSRWCADLDASIISDGGIQKLLDLSVPILKNHIVVVDSALKLIASTYIECDDPITMELIAHGYHTEENITKFRLHKRFSPWASQDGFIVNDTREICLYTTVVYSFKRGESFNIIVIMMCNNVGDAAWLRDAFTLLIKRIGYYVKRDYPQLKPSGNAVDQFLGELLEGTLTEQAIIEERSSFVGLPMNKQFCLFCIEVQDVGTPTQRVLSDVARAVAPAKTVFHDGMIVVLCFNCSSRMCARSCARGACALYSNAVSGRIDRLLDGTDMKCGRSSSFDSLTGVHSAYLQARAVLDCVNSEFFNQALSLGSNSYDNIFRFDDFAIEYLIMREVQGSGESLMAKTTCFRTLQEIRASDEKHGTDNYRFLYVYLVNERRPLQVAEQMHMHRNNIKHRVERLRQLFDIDLDDPKMRFDLSIAFRMISIVSDIH